MNKYRDTRLLFALLSLGVYVLLSINACGYSWWESYRYNKKEPYDLYVLYELLEAREAGLIFNRDTLNGVLLDSSETTNYIYVGGNINMNDEDVTGLLNFIEQGNKAFLFTQTIPDDISYHLFGPACFYAQDNGGVSEFEGIYQDTVNVRLMNKDLIPQEEIALSWIYDHRPTNHTWLHIPDAWLCDEDFGIEILGTLDSNLVNFVKLPYGEGELFFHTNPELFTNYYLSDSSRYDYGLAVLSYLSDGPVIWDEYARNYHPPKHQQTKQAYNPEEGRNLLKENHALRYILEQPPLALAWYILIIGGLLYVVFRSKREQRIIPYRVAPENSSKQFVETIARLTHENGNHAGLAKREVKMLRLHLQEKFGIHWPEGSNLPEELVTRTGLAPEIVQHAGRQIRFVVNRDHIKEGDLLLFYRAIQPIYQI